MKIICKWVFVKDRQLIAKQKDASNMSGDECIDMITTLLAQPETKRIIFEKGEVKNDQTNV